MQGRRDRWRRRCSLVSVLLPTMRPDSWRRSFDSIEAACGDVPYEVIVVASFSTNELLEHCWWMVRERLCVVDALIRAEELARGEYLFSFNDQSVLAPEALERLYHEAESRPGELLTPRHEPAYRFVYYDRIFAPFPFAHRNLLVRLGGIADRAYRSFYSDPDLSMRAHDNGVSVRVVDDAIIYHANVHDHAHQQNVSAHHLADREAFVKRWAHYGVFVEC